MDQIKDEHSAFDARVADAAKRVIDRLHTLRVREAEERVEIAKAKAAAAKAALEEMQQRIAAGTQGKQPVSRLDELLAAVQPDDHDRAILRLLRGDVPGLDALGFLVHTSELPQLQAEVRARYGDRYDRALDNPLVQRVCAALASAQLLKELDALQNNAAPPIISPAAGVEINLTRRGVLMALAQLLGTDEANARDWLIAKVAAFRGESEADTAARLEEL